MPNSAGAINPFFGDGGTVKAWGVYGFNATFPSTMTLKNVVNCYNLNFDDVAYSAQITAYGTTEQGLSTGAIPFKFVTPMKDTKYKIFVNPKITGNGTYSESGRAFFAHALNSTKYPKTTTNFWVRFGLLMKSGESFIGDIVNRPNHAEILNRVIASGAYPYQIQVVVV